MRRLENIDSKKELEQELQAARELQMSLLPQEIPQIQGFEIAARSIPAREVGGDFYDFIKINDNLLGILIGDISGKGITGAMMMAASRNTFRALATGLRSPGTALTRVNERLSRDIKRGMFAAVSYAVIDSNTGMIELSNAGLEPLFVDRDSSICEGRSQEGIRYPLGISSRSEYRQLQTKLNEGELLLFYTDGIVEAMNPVGEMYGYERFENFLAAHAQKDGEFIITGETRSFGAERYDVYLIKTDSSGNMLWQKTFGGSKEDSGKSVAETTDREFIITGGTYSFGAGNRDVYLIKTDSSGNMLWQKTFGGSDTDCGISVAEITDGGFIIGGNTDSFGAGNYDVYLIKTDSSGKMLWQKTFGGSDTDCGISVAEITDGEFIITGRTDSFGAGESDVYLIRHAVEYIPVQAHTVTVTAEPSSIIANGVSSSTITITVKSEDERLVKDETVSLIADKGVIPNQATNNKDGTYTAEYTSATVPGNTVITANTSAPLIDILDINLYLDVRKLNQEIKGYFII